jgi:Cellulose biosynthesis protein BcsS
VGAYRGSGRPERAGAGLSVVLRRALRGTDRAAAALVAAAVLAPLAARAQTLPPPRHELFTGFELTNNSASTYVGGGTAFGNSLWSPGWRARAVGSLGRYNYDGSLSQDGADKPQTFDGSNSFVAALAGYQFQRGRATLKLFAGIEAEDQDVSPYDPHNSVQGQRAGLLLQAEGWLNIGLRSFASVDASFGSAFDEYWTLCRFGYQIRPKLALGVEGGALGDAEYDAGRGGGFIRVDIKRTEITLSSGVTGDYLTGQGSFYIGLDAYRAF